MQISEPSCGEPGEDDAGSQRDDPLAWRRPARAAARPSRPRQAERHHRHDRDLPHPVDRGSRRNATNTAVGAARSRASARGHPAKPIEPPSRSPDRERRDEKEDAEGADLGQSLEVQRVRVSNEHREAAVLGPPCLVRSGAPCPSRGSARKASSPTPRTASGRCRSQTGDATARSRRSAVAASPGARLNSRKRSRGSVAATATTATTDRDRRYSGDADSPTRRSDVRAASATSTRVAPARRQAREYQRDQRGRRLVATERRRAACSRTPTAERPLATARAEPSAARQRALPAGHQRSRLSSRNAAAPISAVA